MMMKSSDSGSTDSGSEGCDGSPSSSGSDDLDGETLSEDEAPGAVKPKPAEKALAKAATAATVEAKPFANANST